MKFLPHLEPSLCPTDCHHTQNFTFRKFKSWIKPTQKRQKYCVHKYFFLKLKLWLPHSTFNKKSLFFLRSSGTKIRNHINHVKVLLHSKKNAQKDKPKSVWKKLNLACHLQCKVEQFAGKFFFLKREIFETFLKSAKAANRTKLTVLPKMYVFCASAHLVYWTELHKQSLCSNSLIYYKSKSTNVSVILVCVHFLIVETKLPSMLYYKRFCWFSI